mgnify:CR=1 FL=1
MLTRRVIDRIVEAALDEDAPWGDLTSETLIPEDAVARAELTSREPGVFAGGTVFAAAFRLTDPSIDVDVRYGEWHRASVRLRQRLAGARDPYRCATVSVRTGHCFQARPVDRIIAVDHHKWSQGPAAPHAADLTQGGHRGNRTRADADSDLSRG